MIAIRNLAGVARRQNQVPATLSRIGAWQAQILHPALMMIVHQTDEGPRR